MNVRLLATNFGPLVTILAPYQAIVNANGLGAYAQTAFEHSFVTRFRIGTAIAGIAYPCQAGYNSANYLLCLSRITCFSFRLLMTLAYSGTNTVERSSIAVELSFQSLLAQLCAVSSGRQCHRICCSSRLCDPLYNTSDGISRHKHILICSSE